MYRLEAIRLRNCWAVKPLGQLGTCGYYPYPWTVVFVPLPKAKTPEAAIRIAKTKGDA